MPRPNRIREIVTDPESLADPEISRTLRNVFRRLNRLMVLMWRLGLGPWFLIAPRLTGRVLVLIHTGRRSGLRRRTPLNYAEYEGRIYCLAGFGAASDWYRNVSADPAVEIWLPGGRRSGIVADVSDHPRRRELLREVLVSSGFAARAFGVPPTLSDDRLDAMTRDYRLLEITPTDRPVTEPGPGELWWVWPTAALTVAAWMLARRTTCSTT